MWENPQIQVSFFKDGSIRNGCSLLKNNFFGQNGQNQQFDNCLKLTFYTLFGEGNCPWGYVTNITKAMENYKLY